MLAASTSPPNSSRWTLYSYHSITNLTPQLSALHYTRCYHWLVKRFGESMLCAVRPRGRLIALDYTVPRRISLLARIARGFTERDERSFLNFHPEHYENFQEFMRNGGLHTWIQKWGQPLEAEYSFWGETVAVVVANRSASD